MKTQKFLIITVLLIMSLLASCRQSDPLWLLESPDQSITVKILQQESGLSSGLFYVVHRKVDGSLEKIMDPSPLGLVCESGRFVEDLEFFASDENLNQIDSYTLVSGKKLSHSNTFNALSLTFLNKNDEAISVIFRAYNDGIAFQYQLKPIIAV